MPKVETDVPEMLRPYEFHGWTDYTIRNDQAHGDCPFCGRPKFDVRLDSGVASCWGCPVLGAETEKGGVNARSFLRLLHKVSDEGTHAAAYPELQVERGFLYPETLMQWGAVKSVIDGKWLIPGYNCNGEIWQLYSLRAMKKKDGSWGSVLYGTPGQGMGLYGANLFNPECETVWLTEGFRDGGSLWEIFKACGPDDDGKLKATANPDKALLKKNSVLALPGVNSWHDAWASLLEGKKVVIAFDSDHPKIHNGKQAPPVGWTWAEALTRKLGASDTNILSLDVVTWGSAGYHPELPSGYDVYDSLTSKGPELNERISSLTDLMGLVLPVPEDWLQGRIKAVVKGKPTDLRLRPKKCEKYSLLTTAWKKALSWRRELDDVISVLLAVCISTEQQGDQLMMQLIGPPGAAKSTIADALLVSPKCHMLEHLTGFLSGVKDDSGEDFSVLSRINRKTLVTSEGDVLATNPAFPQIMSQIRRIFDGKTTSTYKNMKEDRQYHGLRTPWIIAATPKFLENNQSSLGDRFLRVHISNPDAEERSKIQQRAGYAELRAVMVTSDGTPESQMEPRIAEAYSLTGGYVDYLRERSQQLLQRIKIENQQELVEFCESLGEFVAAYRARPAKEVDREHESTKEMATRLTKQFVRLAICLAAVIQAPTITPDVKRRMRKVAVDTSRGKTFDIAQLLYPTAATGLPVKSITDTIGITEPRTRALLRFMREIGLAEYINEKGVRWRLRRHVRETYKEIVRDA